MENKNNQYFNINESDELTKLKILNTTLIKELRKYKEEYTQLRHEYEILNSIIENLEEENKALKNKSFPEGGKLKKHIYTVPKINKDYEIQEYYNCKPCRKLFSQAGDLKNHVQRVHEKEKISSNNQSNNEMTDTHSLQVEKFKCEICDKKFSQKYNLKNHIENVHGGSKRYECDKCSQKFTEKQGLTLHIRGVHEKIKEFNCDRCGKNYSKKYNLKVHVQTVHEKEKKIICQICKKGFGLLKTLQQHSVLHKR